jgi:hypothetical protein
MEVIDDTEPAAASSDDYAELAKLLRKVMGTSVDEDRVKELIAEGISKVNVPRRIHIVPKQSDAKPIDLGLQHYKFILLKALGEIRVLPIYLHGPSGSGKSYAAEAMAKAFELPYASISCNADMSSIDFLGYQDAHGKYVTKPFRKLWEYGGVFLVDESDAMPSEVQIVANGALANGKCAFPDGMVPRHEDFIWIACGNTVMRGADPEYAARVQVDAATIQRYAFVEWDYDWSIVAAHTGATYPQQEFDLALGGFPNDQQWADDCKRYSRAAESLKIRHVVSPRTVINGNLMFKQGIGRVHTEAAVLWQGLDQDQVTRIKEFTG